MINKSHNLLTFCYEKMLNIFRSRQNSTYTHLQKSLTHGQFSLIYIALHFEGNPCYQNSFFNILLCMFKRQGLHTFFLTFHYIFFYFREGKEERKRGQETSMWDRNIDWLLSQPRIQLATFWFMGWYPTNGTTLAKPDSLLLFFFFLSIFCWLCYYSCPIFFSPFSPSTLHILPTNSLPPPTSLLVHVHGLYI